MVRSFGIDVAAAIALADLLRERRATIVVYDYCLFACASYLFVASARTSVLRDALVAWRHSASTRMTALGLRGRRTRGPLRLDVGYVLVLVLSPEVIPRNSSASRNYSIRTGLSILVLNSLPRVSSFEEF